MMALLWGLAAVARPRSRRAPLTHTVTRPAFAGWKGLILALTADANIRVDMLFIAPLHSGLRLWGLISILTRLKR